MNRDNRDSWDLFTRDMDQKSPITADDAFRMGQTFALWNKARASPPLAIALGHDAGTLSDSLAQACAEGIASAGCNAVLFGQCPAPALYACLKTISSEFKASVGVMDRSDPRSGKGFDFFTRDGYVSSHALRELSALADEAEGLAHRRGEIFTRDILPEYSMAIRRLIGDRLSTDVAMPLLGLHMVVDTGKGTGGFFAGLLRSLGASIVEPRPLAPEAPLSPFASGAEASSWAMAPFPSEAPSEHGADLALALSADCSRASFTSHDGSPISRNRLMALVSALLLDRDSGLTILTDSVTSSGLSKFIGEWGGEHYRFKRGFRIAIEEAKRLNEAGINCPLAIGTGGKAAFRDNGFIEDGIFLSVLLVCECMRLKREGKPLLSLTEGLEEPVESVELRLRILPDDFREAGIHMIEKVMDHASSASHWHLAPDNREGVRISLDLDKGRDNAWFLLRLSVHAPILVLNAESDVEGGVSRILSELYRLLDSLQAADLMPMKELISRNLPPK